MNFKKIFKFLLFLLPWFFSSLFMISNNDYYSSLNLPFFAPPGYVFGIVWPILFILIAISIYMVWDYSEKYYKKVLLINFIFNQLYTFCFFFLKSPFLGFVDTVLVFITSLYLFEATYELNKKASKFLIPYIIWNIFALILSLSITIMN